MKVYAGMHERVTDPFVGVGSGRHDGWVEHYGLVVTVCGRPLDPRLDICAHSPTGFECGYIGSGPRQLALAILADFTGDDDLAASYSWEFMHDVISRLPRFLPWVLNGDEIERWLRSVGAIAKACYDEGGDGCEEGFADGR